MSCCYYRARQKKIKNYCHPVSTRRRNVLAHSFSVRQVIKTCCKVTGTGKEAFAIARLLATIRNGKGFVTTLQTMLLSTYITTRFISSAICVLLNIVMQLSIYFLSIITEMNITLALLFFFCLVLVLFASEALIFFSPFPTEPNSPPRMCQLVQVEHFSSLDLLVGLDELASNTGLVANSSNLIGA